MRSCSVRLCLLSLILALHLPASGQVLDPPSLRCVSVGPAGDVLLTWVVPPDPTAIFLAYEIYHAVNAGGPYALLTSIPVYGQDTFFHAGAGGDTGPQYYYMVTLSTSPPPNASLPGSVLASMFLTVNQSTPLGSAVIDWTTFSVPLPPTSATSAGVAMEHPQGTWSSIATVADPVTYVEQVTSICDDSLTFRISLADDIGCVNLSNLAGGSFQDVTPPSIPIMSTVTVDPVTGQTIVTWAPSPEGDTDGYIIVFVDPPSSIIVDTINGQNNTQYIYPLSDATAGPESYTIAAIDTCLSGIPPSPNTSATFDPHTTIHVTTTYDRCGGDITIDWTPYIGFEVQSYELYAQQDGGAIFLLGTYSPTVSTAFHADVVPFAEYCYVVRAVESGGPRFSNSNRSCRIADYPPVPQWNYIRLATVLADDHVQVVDSIETAVEAKRYRLERASNGEPWMPIASAPGGPGPVIVFNDLDVQADQRSYQYRILVDDSCGNEVVESNIGSTILLVAEAGLDGVNSLRWNGYEDWAGAVSGYEVYRSIGDGPYALVAVTGQTEWSYEDDVTQLVGTNGRFCYQVRALESGNPAGIDATSESNVVCAIQPEQVWIPNAFIAGGINSSFKPVIAYVDIRNYEFSIFNRWGQQFWTTDDPERSWDGTLNGAPVPQGVYAYYCAFQNGAGQRQVKRGTVTFIWGQE